MWVGCQYGHNLEPHRPCLVYVIWDVMSGTLHKVVRHIDVRSNASMSVSFPAAMIGASNLKG